MAAVNLTLRVVLSSSLLKINDIPLEMKDWIAGNCGCWPRSSSSWSMGLNSDPGSRVDSGFAAMSYAISKLLLLSQS